MTRLPHPLQWPDGWERTPNDQRERSQFSSRAKWNHPQYGETTYHLPVSLVEATDAVLDELVRLGANNITITSNLPTKPNGLPYADGRAEDPGIAVWWTLDGLEQVIACDRWERPAENMRAIAKTIDAIRGMARWGSSAIIARAFAGFAALPPSSAAAEHAPLADAGPEPSRAWMLYFHVTEAASRAGLKTMYRRTARAMHPDLHSATGPGDHAAATAATAELLAKWKQAEAWLDWRDRMMGIGPDDGQ